MTQYCFKVFSHGLVLANGKNYFIMTFCSKKKKKNLNGKSIPSTINETKAFLAVVLLANFLWIFHKVVLRTSARKTQHYLYTFETIKSGTDAAVFCANLSSVSSLRWYYLISVFFFLIIISPFDSNLGSPWCNTPPNSWSETTN